MVINLIMFVYIMIVTVSSIWLEKASHLPSILISAFIFTLSLLVELWKPKLRFFQVVALALFHFSSQLNWCQPLYMLLAFKECYRIHSLKRSFIIAFTFVSVYSAIRISYLPDTLYNILVTFFDMANFMVVILTLYYIIKMEKEKRSLSREKHHLTTRDPLTGLLNYAEYHKRLNKLLKKEGRFVLLLIDCIDLKSMNDEQGYRGGDRILIKVADFLREFFKDAYMIAHYGGDEFAVAIKGGNENNTIAQLTAMLEKRLFKELEVKITYGYAVYPNDGHKKDTLVSAAEQKLFDMKRDIWLQREEQILRAEKLKLVGELAAGIAHEIRNPLTTVRGFLQLAKRNDYNIGPWYELMMGETARVSELTAEFLQFSKPHAIQFKIQSLKECIERVLYLTKSEATYHGHELRFECTEDGLPVYARFDKDKIVQLLINLVRNAYDAMTDAGTVTIRLKHEEDKALIVIEDTGKGIPASHMDKIFNPFFTTKETGTGLGLSVCHQIMHDHNGTIEVNSMEGVGTRVLLRLPLVREGVQPEHVQTV